MKIFPLHLALNPGIWASDQFSYSNTCSEEASSENNIKTNKIWFKQSQGSLMLMLAMLELSSTGQEKRFGWKWGMSFPLYLTMCWEGALLRGKGQHSHRARAGYLLDHRVSQIAKQEFGSSMVLLSSCWNTPQVAIWQVVFIKPGVYFERF